MLMNVEELRREAEAGDIPSMTALGTRLLIGRDATFEPEEGAKLVALAVERGDAQAMSVMATLRCGRLDLAKLARGARLAPARGRRRCQGRLRTTRDARGRPIAGR